MATVCADLQVGAGCTEGTTACQSDGHRYKCVSGAWVDQGADSSCSTSTRPVLSEMASIPVSPIVDQPAKLSFKATAGAGGAAAGLSIKFTLNGVDAGNATLEAFGANEVKTISVDVHHSASPGAPQEQGWGQAGTFNVCVKYTDGVGSSSCANITVTDNTPPPVCTAGATQCVAGRLQKCVNNAWVDQNTCVGCPGSCTPGAVTCDPTTKHQYTCNADGCGKTDNGVTARCNPVCTDGQSGPCNGFKGTTCQNNAWVDTGCSTECGAVCNDGETKQVDCYNYQCQDCSWVNMGEVPGCNPEPCDLICQLKKYSPIIAVVGLVMVGMVTFKGGGGSGGSRSDYGVNLDQMFYGYK